MQFESFFRPPRRRPTEQPQSPLCGPVRFASRKFGDKIFVLTYSIGEYSKSGGDHPSRWRYLDDAPASKQSSARFGSKREVSKTERKPLHYCGVDFLDHVRRTCATESSFFSTLRRVHVVVRQPPTTVPTFRYGRLACTDPIYTSSLIFRS